MPKEVAMDIVRPRVAGIDVHKKVIWVAVRLPGSVPGERKVNVRSFKTFWRSLQKMAAWLAELGVTDAAMESTGVYWWPVYHALAQAGTIEVCVCNAAHMRNVPGRKTDIRDCQWIAELHEHGLLRASFIPGQQVAALRARTRYRKKLTGHRASESQRLPEVLEDAGIKIDSVASELLGVSGRDMIDALIGGERDPFRLAGLARAGCAPSSISWRWPVMAGSPPGTPSCAGSISMPTSCSLARSPRWTSWSSGPPSRSRRSSPG
jgi:transposase